MGININCVPLFYDNVINGNMFRVTGPLCGEFTGHRWIPHTNASDAELWSFLWSGPDPGWVNNREAGDLIRVHAHYDVIVMLLVILRENPRWPVDSPQRWPFMCNPLTRIFSHICYLIVLWKAYILNYKHTLSVLNFAPVWVCMWQRSHHTIDNFLFMLCLLLTLINF